MITTLQKRTSAPSTANHANDHRSLADSLSERFWFFLSFILFIILGPFSGPIALIILLKLGLEESSQIEPESLAVR